MGTLSLSLGCKKGMNVITSEHESTRRRRLTFTFPATFSFAFAPSKVTSELANWLTCETPPNLPGLAILPIDRLGSFSLRHGGEIWHVFIIMARIGGRVRGVVAPFLFFLGPLLGRWVSVCGRVMR